MKQKLARAFYKMRYRILGPRPRYGYMCQVDFDYELENAKGGCPVYASVSDLKKERGCVRECGIVKVKITRQKVIEKGIF